MSLTSLGIASVERAAKVEPLDAAMQETKRRLADQAEALHELTQHRGWAILMRCLQDAEVDIGRVGLRDKSRSRDYYEGAQDMIPRLLQLVPEIIEQGREVAAEQAIAANPKLVARFVADRGGSLS